MLLPVSHTTSWNLRQPPQTPATSEEEKISSMKCNKGIVAALAALFYCQLPNITIESTEKNKPHWEIKLCSVLHPTSYLQHKHVKSERKQRRKGEYKTPPYLQSHSAVSSRAPTAPTITTASLPAERGHLQLTCGSPSPPTLACQVNRWPGGQNSSAEACLWQLAKKKTPQQSHCFSGSQLLRMRNILSIICKVFVQRFSLWVAVILNGTFSFCAIQKKERKKKETKAPKCTLLRLIMEN